MVWAAGGEASFKEPEMAASVERRTPQLRGTRAQVWPVPLSGEFLKCSERHGGSYADTCKPARLQNGDVVVG